nr:PREDICTED: uncharacterized protein LOC108201479 [Daucus carota subsp. sativus]
MAIIEENTSNNEREENFEDEYRSITLETSHPIYLHPSDHPGLNLVTIVLNGDNFNEWKRSVTLALSAKNKLGFVNGRFKIPDESSLSSLVYTPLAVDVWNDIHTRFKVLWDDFLNITNVPKCACCSSTCTTRIQAKKHDKMMKVTQFLMGLNEMYTNIRGQLLMMNPMPKLTQVLALLQQEERQRNHVNSAQPTIESAALMNKATTRRSKPEGRRIEFRKNEGKKGNLECTYCHGTNHTKDRCYHLIGFPPRNKQASGSNDKVVAQVMNSQGNSQGNAPTGSESQENGSNQNPEVAINQSTLSTAQYQQLLQLLNQTSGTSGSSADLTQTGAWPHYCSYMTSVCLINCHTSNDWIIDSGATDHITCFHHLLTDVTTCNVDICLPNGHQAQVRMKGNIKRTPDIILYDVLLVPAFQFNLVSVSKLITTLHCVVKFRPKSCIIQDSLEKNVKGIGKLHGNLYKLPIPTQRAPPQTHKILSAPVSSKAAVCSISQLENFQVWHSRLGHTPVNIFKNTDSIAILDNTNKLLPCDVCHYAKHSRSFFPKSLSHAASPFDVIHYDLWGPYRHKTYATCKGFLTTVDDCSRCTWTYLMSSKTQFKTKVKVVRTDNGTEFFNKEINSLFDSLELSFIDSLSPVSQTPQSTVPPVSPQLSQDETALNGSPHSTEFRSYSMSPDQNLPTHPSEISPSVPTHVPEVTPAEPAVRPQRTKVLPHKFSDFTGLPPTVIKQCASTVAVPYNITDIDTATQFTIPYIASVTNLSSKIPEPSTYKQVVQDSNWCTTMQTEINALEANNTWVITTLPPDKHAAGCK